MHRQVAAYARVSTERQAETQTIEQQIERVRAYAQAQGDRARGTRREGAHSRRTAG